jgi:predicted small metal-binding protein
MSTIVGHKSWNGFVTINGYGRKVEIECSSCGMIGTFQKSEASIDELKNLVIKQHIGVKHKEERRKKSA